MTPNSPEGTTEPHNDAHSTVIESDGVKELAARPLITIGVPTYHRHELLKQTLASILAQTFSDFEVIIGNDYTGETLSAELLGIADPRIRIVNHPRNLGELANMNALLRLACGKYFTWQFDDDLYAPQFLAAVHAALKRFDFPPCVFTAYEFTDRMASVNVVRDPFRKERFFSGRQFLRMYLSRRANAMGCTGVYNVEYLRSIGGVRPLADGPFALYSEYLLLMQAGLLEKVVYIDEPLVFYRAHEGSWSPGNREIALYQRAGKNLVAASVDIFRKPELRADFHRNLASLLKLPLNVLIDKLVVQDGRLQARIPVTYLFSIREAFNSLKGTALYWTALACLVQAGVGSMGRVVKAMCKSAMPSGVVNIGRSLRSFFVRREHRPFWG